MALKSITNSITDYKDNNKNYIYCIDVQIFGLEAKLCYFLPKLDANIFRLFIDMIFFFYRCILEKTKKGWSCLFFR